MSQKEHKYQAPALEKGLDILEYLSAQSIPQSATEIASGIGKTSNEIYRMLIILENKGYILKDEVSGKYTLSLKLFYLSHQHGAIEALRQAALRAMEELSHRVKEACHLSILYQGKLMVILHVKSPAPVALSIEEGSLFEITKTASGRVFLAYLSERERITLLNGNEVYLGYSDTKKEHLQGRFRQIRADGYHLMESDLAMGVIDIAVPLYQEESGIIACLTISRLTKINTDAKQEQLTILKELQYTAAQILARIGFTPPPYEILSSLPPSSS